MAPFAVDVFEQTYAYLRGGAWFRLAVWLAQRDEEAVAQRLAAEKEAKRAKGKAKPKRDRYRQRVRACSRPVARAERVAISQRSHYVRQWEPDSEIELWRARGKNRLRLLVGPGSCPL